MTSTEDVRAAYLDRLTDTSLSDQEFEAFIARVKAMESMTTEAKTRKQ